MAFSIRMTGMKWCDGEYIPIEVPGEMSGDRVSITDFGFRKIDISVGYLDYFSVLSVDEAIELAKSHYEGFPVAFDSTWKHVRQSLGNVDFVIAHLFEWESGLG